MESDLGLLRVRVVFQTGQTEMTAREIQELAPGALVALDRTIEDVIDIVANGKRIGRGQLVKVGDSLAVRVTMLNSDG